MTFSADLRAFASSQFDDDAGGIQPGKRPQGERSRPTIILAASLISRVQARDADAFRELVQTLYVPLVRFARSLLGSHDDAKDVVQDVLALVWDLGPRWIPNGDPVAYLFASVRNHALKEIRRRDRAHQRAQRAHSVDLAVPGNPEATEHPNALDQVIETEVDIVHRQHVSIVLSTLSERYRTVYELRYRRGLSVSAIAEVLGTSVKSAEHLTARVTQMVLERLRQRISRII